MPPLFLEGKFLRFVTIFHRIYHIFIVFHQFDVAGLDCKWTMLNFHPTDRETILLTFQSNSAVFNSGSEREGRE